MRRKRKKEQRVFRPVATFLKIVVSIVLVFCITAGVAAYACYKITGGFDSSSGGETAQSGKPSLVDALKKKDIMLNVAVFGVDNDGTRTDVMFVVHFDSKNKRLSLLSLPRDTRVEVCDTVVARLKQAGKYYKSPAKLNAIHAYSPSDEACENTVLQIEDLLDINIDHYVKVNLEAFRKIVDTVGGIEVDVPQDMSYDDPYQDLHIHLKAGSQLLDGDKAEQLVRFRHYPQGDVARVEVQQMFLKEFARKVLDSDTVVKNLPDYISMLYKYVETDVSLMDALKYVNYVDSVDMNNVTMETLPGVGEMIGEVSYFVHDEDETKIAVDRIFYGIGVPADGTEAVETDSKSLAIEVSNGGSIQGLAGRTEQRLSEEGYNVVSVTNFSGERKEETRIYVKEAGQGTDLISYFNDAKVLVDDTYINSGTDIRIVLGTKETQ